MSYMSDEKAEADGTDQSTEEQPSVFSVAQL